MMMMMMMMMILKRYAKSDTPQEPRSRFQKRQGARGVFMGYI